MSYLIDSSCIFHQVHLLESDLDRKTHSLKDAEGRLADLEREYEGYKVRAASVLRKANDEAAAANHRSEVNVGGDSTGGSASNRSPEVMALERMVEALNTKIGDLGSVSEVSQFSLAGCVNPTLSIETNSHNLEYIILYQLRIY